MLLKKTRHSLTATAKRSGALAGLLLAGALALTACESGYASTGASDKPIATPGDTANDVSVLRQVAGTAKSRKAAPNTGDWATGPDGTPNTAAPAAARRWTELRVERRGDLGKVVVNGARLTLYRFDNDDAEGGVSNCNDECAKTWPPVIVQPGAKVFIAGVPFDKVGHIKRQDGTIQLTVGKWPVYRFAKDTKPGDIKGQGVGGTWFAVKPNGDPAGAPPEQAPEQAPDDAPEQAPVQEEETEQPPTTAPGTPLTATDMILFDDANFSDNGASQGVAGKGCQELARDQITSSISVRGTAKIWAGPNCTGEVITINGDVLDLAELDFDDKIVSVRLAD